MEQKIKIGEAFALFLNSQITQLIDGKTQHAQVRTPNKIKNKQLKINMLVYFKTRNYSVISSYVYLCNQKMKMLTLFYDNYCPNCTRFSKWAERLDWFHLLSIRPVRNELHTQLFSDINLELATQQMASFGKKWHYGFDSLFYIFVRLPLFWPLLPAFYFLKTTQLGQLLYKELALRRKIIPLHCAADGCAIDFVTSSKSVEL